MSELPAKINQIKVSADNIALGLLTHSSVHLYQPTQSNRHVSLTMTRPGLEAYSSGALHPIFSQNLPEGFNRRYIAEKLARYAKVNDMYLLALQGNHGIGMLSYTSDLCLPEVDEVSLSDILTYNSQEPLFPQLLNKYYLRNSLAGVQPKVNIPRSSFKQTGRTVEQKDLIVKSFDSEFPLLTVNEYVCMQAAAHCRLEPPKHYLSDNLETFVVERFDKHVNGFDCPYFGYEDFTTLLKKTNDPDAKYSGSYETLLKATYLYTNRLAEVEKMYRYIVFNCLIGNGDAHLKNFALQYTPDMKSVFVSPPFDITHTIIYPNIDNKMALKLANSKQFPDYTHLLKLADIKGIKIRAAASIIESLAEGILDYLNKSNEVLLFKGLRESIQDSVAKVVTKTYTTKNYRHDPKKKFN